ncbi:unnamed protein product [Owenia fusiformis]|uniref:Uncharacterized protein n=1 Tax=Owenia fusiformis TaxID=6347 RepID=A0A8J1TZE3_OWEFU|nr:unnamed protein product [Owenia fusiformis]
MVDKLEKVSNEDTLTMENALHDLNKDLLNVAKIKRQIEKGNIEAIQTFDNHRSFKTIKELRNKVTTQSVYKHTKIASPKTLEDVKNHILDHLTQTQNPSDCNKQNKLLCHLAKPCEFACQFHHLVYCFIVGYTTNRTVVIDATDMDYSIKGWEDVFRPVSTTCTSVSADEYDISTPECAMEALHPQDKWMNLTLCQSSHVISLPPLDWLIDPPRYITSGIPDDVAILLSVHISADEALLFWISTLVGFLFQLNDNMEKEAKSFEFGMGINHPVVGLDIKRVDVDNHSLKAYMDHVDRYYDAMDPDGIFIRRRVYLVTDDPDIRSEARDTYQNYQFITNTHYVYLEETGISPITGDELKHNVRDLYILSECDFVVGTFSSQISRLTFELKTFKDDEFEIAFDNMVSLDSKYFFTE